MLQVLLWSYFTCQLGLALMLVWLDPYPMFFLREIKHMVRVHMPIEASLSL